MKPFIVILLALLIVGCLVYSPIPVRADCGDVNVSFDARQFYAPLQVEVDFTITPNRSGDWTSNGLKALVKAAKTANLNIGSDSVVFSAYGNDTYTFWVSGSYATAIVQNITVTVVEGDRPPAREHYCMNGTFFYFHWIDQTLVVEQHPPTLDQIAGSIFPGISAGLAANAAAVSSVNGGVFLNTIAIAALLFWQVILTVALWRWTKRFR